MTFGVDLYRYQTVTDWAALARSARYAWVKLTDGIGPALVRGDGQVRGCKVSGIPVGGYHYAQFGNPEQQAAVFLGEVRRLGALDLAPALDLEAPFTANPAARDFGVRFCRAVAAAGYRPAVYMSASFAGALRPDQWGIPGLVIWLAAYGGNDGNRRSADLTRHYPGRWDVHQYASTARVPGISGQTDVNWAATGVPLNNGDDMDADDKNKLDEVWRTLVTGSGYENTSLARNLASVVAQVTAAITTNTTGGKVDVDKLTASLSDAAAKAAADAVRTQVLPALTTVLTDVLGADNTAQADEIVDRLAERLGAAS